MKRLILNAMILLLPVCLFSQEMQGKLNVSDWALFAVTEGSSQIKKIDDSTMYAYYREGSDKSGILIFDRKMNVIRNIPLELTDNKKVIFTRKALARFVSFPYTFYRPDIRAVVIIMYYETERKTRSVVGITYSIDGAGLLDIAELAETQSDNFSIKHSENDEFFVVAELLKEKVDKNWNISFNVFNKACENVYSAKSSLYRNIDSYYFLMNNGELINYTVKEKGREITYMFNKYDITGGKTTAAFAPPKTDIYNYTGFEIVKSPAGEYFATCLKQRKKSEGISILKIDFDNRKIKKITDKDFDKAALAKISAKRTKSVSMLEKKKAAFIDDFDTYYIHRTLIDENSIYMVLEDYYVRTVTTKSGTMYTYGSRGIITACYDHDGKEQWIVPVNRAQSSRDDGFNFYNGNGMAVQISVYDAEDNICMLLRSGGRTYYTAIDKETGNDIEPVLLVDDDKAETNANCYAWLDKDEVVVLTMKGLSILRKNDFWLNSYKIRETSL